MKTEEKQQQQQVKCKRTTYIYFDGLFLRGIIAIIIIILVCMLHYPVVVLWVIFDFSSALVHVMLY